MRRVAPALAAVLALGVAARAVDLAHPSVTYDELSDLAQSVRFCAEGDWTAPADGYLNGQLPYLAACGLYRWAPPDPVVSRAMSVAWGALTVLATFLLATRVVPGGWAVVAALLAATSTFAIASSRLGFTHGHVAHVPFLVAGLYLVLDPERRRGSLLLAGLSLGLAAGVDLLAAFIAVSALAWLVQARRGAPRALLAELGLFAAAGAVGVAVASPMYLLHPLEAVASIREALGGWDDLRGYLWLGELRETLPPWYYLVVLAVKANPIVLALAGAGIVLAARARATRAIFLAVCLWPIAYLSFKGWKNPFYVAAFVPLLCVLAAVALDGLRAWRGRAAAAALALALAVDGWTAWRVHPDYLMGGIQWSEALYGEFQGPAVSHGQWIGEALEFIRADAGAVDPLVLMFRDAGEPQAAFYAAQAGLGRVDHSAWADPVARPWALANARYAVRGQDAVRLHSPLHRATVPLNAALVAAVRPPSPFRLVRTFGPAAFPMVWVFRRD
jgi:hypothetical protein